MKKVRVLVYFKKSVLDPQGQTVKNALLTLGYDMIRDVRQGKVFEIELDDLPDGEMEKVIPEIAHKALSNPIIEKFEWSEVE
ncbi:MAG: phosphoribosylformylglycinamidine synthase subunit PurS [Candidatus Aminicenantes bacterium]